ncbi:hypothetical protein CPB83DRAFT_849260 [Crepidotus variabilis]|uniref:Uncharacterized protein n=1 Tax=Crepidotus variabilis TaxID=179855 RepID=A0A9P6JSR9_9AGAR|nr:hypothetical protein CPB83DRAFT_849260 [Crepidotus variabilis]
MSNKPRLSLEARRIRMIIVTAPIMVACSYVLFNRLVLGEERKKLPNRNADEGLSIRIVEKEQKDAS